MIGSMNRSSKKDTIVGTMIRMMKGEDRTGGLDNLTASTDIDSDQLSALLEAPSARNLDRSNNSMMISKASSVQYDRASHAVTFYGMSSVPTIEASDGTSIDIESKEDLDINQRKMSSRVDDVRQLVKNLKKKRKIERQVRTIQHIQQVSDKYSVNVKIPDVPVWVTVCILVLYIVVGGGLFSAFEDSDEWNMFIGIYFSFVTLTTIGFGDFLYGSGLAPGQGQKRSLLVGKGYDSGKMVATGLYIVIGLSLMSMCADLMGQRIKEKLEQIRLHFFLSFDMYTTYIERMQKIRRLKKRPRSLRLRKHCAAKDARSSSIPSSTAV